MNDTTTPQRHRGHPRADRLGERRAEPRGRHRAPHRQHRAQLRGYHHGQHRRARRDRRHGTRRLAGGLVLLAALATACTTTSAPTSAPSSAPTSGPPPSSGSASTVTEVPQPAAGQNGPVVTVDGTVDWVATGYPGCAMLHTTHGQVLELVDPAHSPHGPVIHQRQQAAAAGHGPDHQAERVVGFVPAGVVSSCGGAMSFSVEQVTP